MSSSFSIRYPIEEIPPSDPMLPIVDFRPIPPPLQGLAVEGLEEAKCLMEFPLRIAGKWFLPAPQETAAELEARWQQTGPK